MGSLNLTVEVTATDEAGSEGIVDVIDAPLPWVEVSYLRDGLRRDWIMLNFYSDGPRPFGQSYYVVVYETAGRSERFSSWSTRRTRLQDLDGDGVPEVVFTPVAYPLRYGASSIGTPVVAVLGAGTSIRPFSDYSAVRDSFLAELQAIARHLDAVCDALRTDLGEAVCEYESDLVIIRANLSDILERN
jgi:hypothetical protein